MNRLNRLGVVVICWAGTAAFAQTVSYTDPVMRTPDPAITTPPVVKWHDKPEYPEQMKKTSEIGYVLVEHSIDETGKGVSRGVFGNSPAAEVALGGANSSWDMKQAKVGSKPIATEAYFSVLFNPKPHAGPGYDVSPALKRVAPVMIKGKKDESRPVSILMTLAVDENGQVTGATTDEVTDPAILDALNRQIVKDWSFSPATLAGKPVPCTVTMPVVVQFYHPSPGKRTLPVVIRQEPPVYPLLMRYNGIKGQVLVDFVISKTGTVINAYAAKSSAPWFDEPAVSAVRKWKFRPGTLNGIPVNFHMQVPIVFELNGGGREAYSVSTSGYGKGEYPAQITNVVVPAYPFDLAMDDTSGSAKVKVLINAQGQPIQVSVVSADKPEFGLALAAAAWGYSFNPAYKDGKPAVALVTFSHDFSVLQMLGDDGMHARWAERHGAEEIHSGRELDFPLSPISRRPVVVPGPLKESREVVVEFLIDESGKVQLPRAEGPNQDVLAFAAVQAVSTWLFDPPLINGKPVIVRVKVPMEFKVEEPAKKEPVVP